MENNKDNAEITNKNSQKQNGKVKSFEEISDEIAAKPELKKRQPTIQPKEITEIDY